MAEYFGWVLLIVYGPLFWIYKDSLPWGGAGTQEIDNLIGLFALGSLCVFYVSFVGTSRNRRLRVPLAIVFPFISVVAVKYREVLDTGGHKLTVLFGSFLPFILSFWFLGGLGGYLAAEYYSPIANDREVSRRKFTVDLLIVVISVSIMTWAFWYVAHWFELLP